MEPYRLLTEEGEGYYEEKRSRFLALACAVKTEEEAQGILAARRKAHPEARHHCYAYVCGPRNELTRFSDDGEPSGTGGRPILDVLLGSGLHDTLVVVTRYFGGTLLGTGGLSRAYSTAAADAVANAGSGMLYSGALWEIGIGYGDYARLDRLLLREDIPRESETFLDRVNVRICLLPEQEESFAAALADMTAGSARLEKIRDMNFLRFGGKIFLQND
nr:YigZ family protein [Lachnospiraceae bacterium]